jgi:hypothetical protein
MTSKTVKMGSKTPKKCTKLLRSVHESQKAPVEHAIHKAQQHILGADHPVRAGPELAGGARQGLQKLRK